MFSSAAPCFAATPPHGGRRLLWRADVQNNTTHNTQQVPVLGRSFEEDKQRKASRKRGEEDNAAGIGDFQTGYTYSFSFHSMYIDMAQVFVVRVCKLCISPYAWWVFTIIFFILCVLRIDRANPWTNSQYSSPRGHLEFCDRPLSSFEKERRPAMNTCVYVCLISIVPPPYRETAVWWYLHYSLAL